MNAVRNIGPRPERAALPDGSSVVVRALQPGDVPALCRMLSRCSEETLYRRFMVATPKLSAAAVRWLTELDHDEREALVAQTDGEIVGVARYVRTKPGAAELAVMTEDAWQRRGLGTTLAGRLGAVARVHGIRAFTGTILADNRAALRMLLNVFPTVERRVSHGEMEFRVPLGELRLRVAG